jgi:hypothetical protein
MNGKSRLRSDDGCVDAVEGMVVTQPTPPPCSSPALLSTEIAAARRRVIEARIAELGRFSKRFKASRRRFRLAAFVRWQAAAAERKRRASWEAARSN